MVDPIGPDVDIEVGADADTETVRYSGYDRLDGSIVVTNKRLLVGPGAEGLVGESAREAVAGDDAGDNKHGAGDDAGDNKHGAGDDARADDPDVVAVPLESIPN
ncbi:MAG: hypothetical protein ABEH81_02385 [Halopenitus sp.]